jgi:hypothetical protein
MSNRWFIDRFIVIVGHYVIHTCSRNSNKNAFSLQYTPASNVMLARALDSNSVLVSQRQCKQYGF